MELVRDNLVVIRNNNEEVLVGRKLRGEMAGKFVFPGGKLERSVKGFERRAIAAIREVQEETGIALDADKIRMAGRLRIYGTKFGLVDVFSSDLPNGQQEQSTSELDLEWRHTADVRFFDGMPLDVPIWFPRVFDQEQFRAHVVWNGGALVSAHCVELEQDISTLVEDAVTHGLLSSTSS